MYGARPLTRLEAALFVIVAAVLAAVLLGRLSRYAEEAEKAAMEATVLRVQSALHLRLALAALKGERIDVERWPRGNPFELAGATPGNYLGALLAPDLASLQPGNWLFDQGRGELVYLPKRTRGFSGGSDPVPAVRYRLDAAAPVGASFAEARLMVVGTYIWSPHPE